MKSKIPCMICPVLPMCIQRYEIDCSILYKYINKLGYYGKVTLEDAAYKLEELEKIKNILPNVTWINLRGTTIMCYNINAMMSRIKTNIEEEMKHG